MALSLPSDIFHLYICGLIISRPLLVLLQLCHRYHWLYLLLLCFGTLCIAWKVYKAPWTCWILLQNTYSCHSRLVPCCALATFDISRFLNHSLINSYLFNIISLEELSIGWYLGQLNAFVGLTNLEFSAIAWCSSLSLFLSSAVGSCSPAGNHSFLFLSFPRTLGNKDLVL